MFVCGVYAIKEKYTGLAVMRDNHIIREIYPNNLKSIT